MSGGWQDQYSTIFGGLNFIEFNSEENLVHTLRLNKNVKKELEECLVLCDTKTIHNSGNIHDDLANKIVDKNLKKLIEENVKLCVEIKNSLTRGKLSNFAELLDKSWQIKKSLSNKISNNHLDEIYQNAVRNGAIGGKLLGAGGGGFFLFFVSPFRKFELINYLNSIGLNIMPFVFEEKGLESWVSRLEDFNL